MQKNEGMYCWYCVKIHAARYKVQHRLTIVGMEGWLGEKAVRMENFKFLLKKGIEWMQQWGTNGQRVPWNKFEKDYSQQVLTMRNRQECSLDMPEDNWMYYEDYKARHGEPGSNGLGHTRSTVQGHNIVVIPGVGIGKLRRSHKVQVDLTGVVADSDTAITGEGELESMQAALQASMFSAASTGVSLDQLLGSSAASSTPIATPEKPAKASASSSAAEQPWFFNMMSQGPSAATAPIASPAAGPPPQAQAPEEKTPTKNKRSGGKAGQAAPSVGAPSVAVPKPPKPSLGKRGRPHADRVAQADKILAELICASCTDETYFGKGRSAQLKLMQKIHSSLQMSCDAAADCESFEALTLRVKRMGAAIAVLRTCMSKGADHPDFSAEMDQQLHFLEMKPTAVNDFPIHLHISHQCIKSQQLTGDTFWNRMGKSELIKYGVMEADHTQIQEKIVRAKVLSIARAISTNDVEIELTSLLQDKHWTHVDGLWKSIGDAMEKLHMVAFSNRYPVDAVEGLLDKLSDGDPISSLLVIFPRGRAFCDVIRARVKSRKLGSFQVAKWAALVGRISKFSETNNASSLFTDYAEGVRMVVECDTWLVEHKPDADTVAKLLVTQPAVFQAMVTIRRIALRTIMAEAAGIVQSAGHPDKQQVGLKGNHILSHLYVCIVDSEPHENISFFKEPKIIRNRKNLFNV